MVKHLANIKQIQIVWDTEYVQERHWYKHIGDVLLRVLNVKWEICVIYRRICLCRKMIVGLNKGGMTRLYSLCRDEKNRK